MPVRTEISLRLPNSPGALRDLTRLLVAEGVRLLALSLDSFGQVRLVVDNVGRARALLHEQHRNITARDVLVVPTADDAAAIGTALQLVVDAHANIDYAYGVHQGRSGGTLVLAVDEPLRVAAATGL